MAAERTLNRRSARDYARFVFGSLGRAADARTGARWMLVSIVVGAAAWGATRVSVASALEQLRAQGVPVAYSSALVPPDLDVELDSVTLESVRDALPTVGLALTRRGNLWLVVEGPRRTAAAPVRVSAERGEYAPGDETVIVTGSRHLFASGDGEERSLGADELDRTPTLGGDTMRAVNLLPGMSTMGISVLPRVRGGLDNETLTLLDGVELLDPSHFSGYQNLFSTIDASTIDDVDVYSGGFPARYGNRMSGVVEVDTLEQRDKPTAELGVSLYSAYANARNSDPNAAIDWLAAVRHGESDELMDRLDLQSGRPDFTDATLRVGHAFSPDAKLTVGAFWVDDDISLADGKQHALSSTDSRYLWTRFDGRLGDGLDDTTTLALVSSRHEKDDTSPASESVVGSLHDAHDTTRIALRSDFGYTLGATRQEFGLEADWSRASYDSVATIDRGPIGALFGGQFVAHDIHEAIDGASGGLYWTADVPLLGGVSLQPGLRWDMQTYTFGFESQLSPRVGLKWEPTDALTLRADGGRYFQPQRVYELDTADGLTKLDKPQRADHYIASALWQFATDAQLRLEAYQKLYDRCSPRFENLFNPFVLLPELAADRVLVDASRARARGVDFEYQSQLTTELRLTGRYSYMDADDDVEGRWIPRRWSQHHTATGIGSWTNGTLTGSLSATWHSGWRTSAPPTVVPVGEVVPVRDVMNNRTLRDYVSIDLGLSATWQIGRSTATVYANLTNALDRDNTVGIDYAAAEANGNVLLTPDHTSLLPIVPWIGAAIAF